MPTKIVIDHLAGSRVGQRQEFDPSARLRFGRHPDNEVSFDAHKDLDASTRHAELRHEGGRWTLHDIGSSNGTIIAGQRITRHDLTEGLPIEVEFGAGGPRIRLYIGDPAYMVAVPATIARSPAGPTPPAETMAAPGQPRRPGPRTVAMMVQQAVSEAHDKRGVGRSTQFMKSMVDQAMHNSTKRFKFIILGLSALFMAAIAALVVWNVVLTKASARPVAEIGEAGSRIVHDNRDALYLLAYVEADGKESPFCSSFAVAPTYLATNSHCVDRINELRRQDRKVFAVKNGDPLTRLDVLSVTQHPGYKTNAKKQTTDVALVEVSAPMAKLVRLADAKHLAALDESGTGSTMFTYGFPGRLAKPSEPEATLVQGTIGRVTTLDEKRGSFRENILIQHSAFTMEGTSGSPVFDVSGQVIAVNTGSYVREKDLRMYDPDSKEFKEKVAVAESLSGYNVAIRIDTVEDLLRDKGVSSAGGAR